MNKITQLIELHHLHLSQLSLGRVKDHKLILYIVYSITPSLAITKQHKITIKQAACMVFRKLHIHTKVKNQIKHNCHHARMS